MNGKVLLALFAVLGCGNTQVLHSNLEPEVGMLGGKCYGNGTCSKGLVCDGSVCVTQEVAEPEVLIGSRDDTVAVVADVAHGDTVDVLAADVRDVSGDMGDGTESAEEVASDVVVDVISLCGCAGKECGPDGCGVVCGACGNGFACVLGQCLSLSACGDGICSVGEDYSGCPADCTCVPACLGKECGDDGCGGSCGGCGASEVCNQNLGLCEADSCWPDCGDEVLIPAGNFWMGCNVAVDPYCYTNGFPYHEVYLDGYYIDHTEVTVDAYSACVAAGGCTAPPFISPYCNWGVAGRGLHPVNCVTWQQVYEYCAWAGKRLPTEAEWEKAARGTDGRKYPWGNETATCEYAVTYENGCGCGIDSMMPVCSKSPAGDSPYGLCDMAGNVLEWTADWYLSNYYSTSPASNPTGPISGSTRVYRGGWFCGGPLQVTYRFDTNPLYGGFGFGGRCARTQ